MTWVHCQSLYFWHIVYLASSLKNRVWMLRAAKNFQQQIIFVRCPYSVGIAPLLWMKIIEQNCQRFAQHDITLNCNVNRILSALTFDQQHLSRTDAPNKMNPGANVNIVTSKLYTFQEKINNWTKHSSARHCVAKVLRSGEKYKCLKT